MNLSQISIILPKFIPFVFTTINIYLLSRQNLPQNTRLLVKMFYFLSFVLTQSTSTREHRECNNGWCCSRSRSGPRTFMLNDDEDDDDEAFSETLFFFKNDSSLLRENGCLAWWEEEELHSSKVRRSFRWRQGTFNHHLACVVLVIGFDSKFELGSLNFEFNFCMYWLLKKFDCSEFGSPISVTFGLIMMGFMWYWLYGLCYMMEVARMFYWYCKMTVI